MNVLAAVQLMMVLAEGAQEAPDPRGPGQLGRDFFALEVSRLRCVIGNNCSDGLRGGGYNGISQMTSPDQEETAYVPAYAGINLEHYFDFRPRPETKVFFEPRHAAMTCLRLSENVVELHQPPTPHYQVESWTRFEVKEPYYMDVSFRCIPRARTFEGDVMGVFWASYMNAPENKSIYFLGPGASVERPAWLQFCTQQHNHFSTVMHESQAPPPEEVQGRDSLFSNVSPLRFSEPFYYGRIRNMVLIYAFQPNPYLRFAHSPSGGGPTQDGMDTCPAWDFQLVIPDYEAGQEYGFTMRAIYKPWEGRADVLKEAAGFCRRE